MERTPTCMIWCDGCRTRYWEDVDRWATEPNYVTRSGTLKVSVVCRSCDTLLTAGSPVEAITLLFGTTYVPWESNYIEPDEKEGNAELVRE